MPTQDLPWNLARLTALPLATMTHAVSPPDPGSFVHPSGAGLVGACSQLHDEAARSPAVRSAMPAGTESHRSAPFAGYLGRVNFVAPGQISGYGASAPTALRLVGRMGLCPPGVR